VKRIFYIDRLLLIVSLALFIFYFKNIDGITNILIYFVFFAFNIYLNLLMYKVDKYKRESRMSLKEILDCIPLILGKILSITQTLLMGVYLENNGLNGMLILFILQSYSILSYSYLYENKLISIKSKPLDLDDIINLNIEREFMNQIYIYINNKFNKKSTYCLSKEEYEKLYLYISV